MTDAGAHDRDYLIPAPLPMSSSNSTMQTAHFAERWSQMKPEDNRPPRGGWAPGGYGPCRCSTCGLDFQGAKRASECADCAYARPRFEDLPQLVALCGNPGAGKSEVQKLLKIYGYRPADDAWPVRDFAIRHFGLTEHDVLTQAGKDGMTEVCGVPMKVREVLGRAANSLEKEFGEDIMAWLAVKGCRPDQHYSFGSVRRRQGRVYKSLGGTVIGVRRPGVEPSPFEFDRFDESVVDIWIENDGDLTALAKNVNAVMWSLAEQSVAA